MLKRFFERLKNKCGSVTVEALVSFVGFLFVIITILNVANYCRAQMIISNAVDTAAREMAQYSYFFDMTGMKKFNDYVNENAAIGAANLNDVIDGTNSVYTTLAASFSDTEQSAQFLADKIDNQNLNYQDIQAAALSLDTNLGNVLSSIDSMETALESVERNPILFAKSLAAFATEQGFEMAKSYAVGAPLAKLFTKANINTGGMAVQEYLEKLGVVGGFDGLNFNTSTIFSPGEPNDIHIRCYYKLSLCNFLDKSLFEVPICKEAVCGAWLSGDDNHIKVSEKASVQPALERSMADAGDVSDGNADEGELTKTNPDPLGENSGEDFVVGRIAVEDDDFDDYDQGGAAETREKEENKKHKYYSTYEEYLADFSISEEEAKKLLDENGVFVDPENEAAYQRYLARKKKNGETPRDRIGWKEASGYWTEYSYVARGNKFNNTAKKAYTYNEIVVEDDKGNRFRLDSYNPETGEIVSRKAIDLENTSDATFKGYLDEIKKKYRVGYIIKAQNELHDKKLEGHYVLEIPKSNEKYIDLKHFEELAAEYGVTIKYAEEYPDG